MMVNNKKTHTTLFLVPALGINKTYLDKFGFVNGYLTDANHETKYEKSVYLVFKPKDLALFDKFVQSEKKRTKDLVLEDYDCGYGYTVLVYKFPSKYEKEYDLFLEGKYSKFGKEYIDIFPETTMTIDEQGYDRVDHTLWFHIFNRSKGIKTYWEEKLGVELAEDAEYFSIPEIEDKEGKPGKEVFNIHKFIKEEEYSE